MHHICTSSLSRLLTEHGRQGWLQSSAGQEPVNKLTWLKSVQPSATREYSRPARSAASSLRGSASRASTAGRCSPSLRTDTNPAEH